MRESLRNSILSSRTALFNMAKDCCWNQLSNNCLYLLSEIEDTEENFHEQRRRRRQQNSLKTPQTLAQILPTLEEIYDNLYDVNLYVYHAKKRITLIEIQYYPISSLDSAYAEKVRHRAPMFHSKITIPPYRKDDEEKFDINWELGGIKHRWKMFWWWRKGKRGIENHPG